MRVLIVLAALLTLQGCGFTPLYATPGARAGLSAVQVEVPDGRVAFLLRQELDDDLARDKAARPKYRLKVDLDQTRDPLGLLSDNTAQRYQMTLKASYKLIDAETGQVVHSGAIVSNVAYDASDAPYAALAAREDVQNRLASDAARRIQIELAAWMARRGG